MAGKGIGREKREKKDGRGWLYVCMYVGLGEERCGWIVSQGGTNEGMMQLMQTGRNNLDTDRCNRSRQTYRPEFQIKINQN